MDQVEWIYLIGIVVVGAVTCNLGWAYNERQRRRGGYRPCDPGEVYWFCFLATALWPYAVAFFVLAAVGFGLFRVATIPARRMAHCRQASDEHSRILATDVNELAKEHEG